MITSYGENKLEKQGTFSLAFGLAI